MQRDYIQVVSFAIAFFVGACDNTPQDGQVVGQEQSLAYMLRSLGRYELDLRKDKMIDSDKDGVAELATLSDIDAMQWRRLGLSGSLPESEVLQQPQLVYDQDKYRMYDYEIRLFFVSCESSGCVRIVNASSISADVLSDESESDFIVLATRRGTDSTEGGSRPLLLESAGGEVFLWQASKPFLEEWIQSPENLAAAVWAGGARRAGMDANNWVKVLPALK